MSFNAALICLVIVTSIVSNDTNIEPNFIVVSTTPSPSVEDQLTKLKNLLKDSNTKTQKEDQNLAILTKIEKSLRNIEQKFERIEISKTSATLSRSLEDRWTKIENQLANVIGKTQKIDQNSVAITEMEKSFKNIQHNFEGKTSSNISNSAMEDRLIQMEKSLEALKSFANATSEDRIVNIENQIEDLIKQKIDQNATAIVEVQKLLKKFEQNTIEQKNSTNKILPKHCKDVMSSHNASGIYLIKPESSPKAFKVLCNMETHGGGWTYFLNRMDGSQDFYQDWNTYKDGFGNLSGEFWLGLEHLYKMTGRENNELLVEMEDLNGIEGFAHYTAFGIGSEQEGYPLRVLGGYNGTAGDSLSNDLGQKFSTKDRDQDSYEGLHCANRFHGGFWYNSCGYANPCGTYIKNLPANIDLGKLIWWFGFKSSNIIYYKLKKIRMMIRPKE